VIDRAPPNRLVLLVERYLPNRAGVALTVLMLLGSAGLGIVKGGHADDFMAALSDTRNALANSAGFRITTVAINGRKHLSQDEVLAIGGVNGRSSLLFLDAATVRDRLKANPWIADATILKLYPGQLQIDIVERTAFALWQQDGRLSVISEDGAVLEPYVSRRFVTLPLVVGKGADVKARDFPRASGPLSAGSRRDQGCDPGRRTALEFAAEGRPRHSPAGERRRQCACHAEQARQGGPAVLARHRRRRHAAAGPAHGAIVGGRGQGPRRTVQGKETQEKGR
jgi:cell division protein FtsQ